MKKIYMSKIHKAFKNKVLLRTLLHAISNRMPLRWISNKKIRDLHLQSKTKNYLKHKYKKQIKTFIEKNSVEEIGEFNKVVWICWLQGLETAPELVKCCVSSIKKNMPNYEVNIITYDNLSKYVDLPSYILNKYKMGTISNAHFSDIIRSKLLISHGGVWIDSTVFCTNDKMCNIFENNDLFVYKDLTNPSIICSSWLISAKCENIILKMTYYLLLEYWKKEKILKHYYLFHLFFSIATEIYSDDWSKVPTYDNATPHILVGELNNEYNSNRFKQLIDMSSYFKLNYKNKYSIREESVYYHLISNTLGDQNEKDW